MNQDRGLPPDRTRDLGKIIGYCPDCRVPICQKEINHHCSRCNKMLREHNLVDDPKAVTGEGKQTHAQSTRADYSY